LAVRDIDRFIDDNAAALGSTPTSQAQAQLNAARQSLDDHSKVQATGRWPRLPRLNIMAAVAAPIRFRCDSWRLRAGR
jgi:hypothetical protein